jgi:hypothetical protein
MDRRVLRGFYITASMRCSRDPLDRMRLFFKGCPAAEHLETVSGCRPRKNSIAQARARLLPSPRFTRLRHGLIAPFIPLRIRGHHMTIQRIETGARMSKVVIPGDTVYLAGFTANKALAGGVAEQTAEILSIIDGYLAKAGTDKTKLRPAARPRAPASRRCCKGRRRRWRFRSRRRSNGARAAAWCRRTFTRIRPSLRSPATNAARPHRPELPGSNRSDGNHKNSAADPCDVVTAPCGAAPAGRGSKLLRGAAPWTGERSPLAQPRSAPSPSSLLRKVERGAAIKA